MKPYDGMLGVVEQKCKSQLCIATTDGKLKNLLKYEQLGVYEGDTDGIEETDTVRIFFKHNSWKSIIKEKGFWRGILEISRGINIEKVEFVSKGERPKGIKKLWKTWF